MVRGGAGLLGAALRHHRPHGHEPPEGVAVGKGASLQGGGADRGARQPTRLASRTQRRASLRDMMGGQGAGPHAPDIQVGETETRVGGGDRFHPGNARKRGGHREQ